MIDALLKKVMQECKLKQPDLAEVLGASLDRVKSLTSGRVKNLTREESEALIAKLDIRANWLVTGEGPMFQQDDESDEEFVSRHQAINRMCTLIKAMPLREFTQVRLQAVMSGDLAEDGAVLARAIRLETLGIDFVNGKPIPGVASQALPLPADEQMWLDTYREWSTEVKKRELLRAMGLAPTGVDQAEPVPAMGNNNQFNSAPAAVQVGGNANGAAFNTGAGSHSAQLNFRAPVTSDVVERDKIVSSSSKTSREKTRNERR